MEQEKLIWKVKGHDERKNCDILECYDDRGLPYGEYNGYRRDRFYKWIVYPRRPAPGVRNMPIVKEVYYNQRRN